MRPAAKAARHQLRRRLRWLEQLEARIVLAAPVAQDDAGFVTFEDAPLTLVPGSAVYNAGADFLANEQPDNTNEGLNPNFTAPWWSYGRRNATLDTTLTLFNASNHVNNGDGTQGFTDLNVQCCGRLPSIVVNTGPAGGRPDGNVAIGDILMHPDGDGPEEKAVVRFTAPQSGVFSLTAFWEDVDDCCGSAGTGVDVHVVRHDESGSAALFSDVISRELNDAYTEFNGTVSLTAGDRLDFVVGTNTQLFGDSTRFNAILSRQAGLLADNGHGPDSDADGDALTVVAFDGVSANGATVSVTPAGGFTYDPRTSAAAQNLATGQSLIDTFSYTISDGASTSTATVSVVVNGATDALGDSYVVTENSSLVAGDASGNVADQLSGDGSFNGVLANDGPAGTLEVKSVQSATTAGPQLLGGSFMTPGDGSRTFTTSQGATVVMQDNGTFTYNQNGLFDALAAGQTATDSFDYTYTRVWSYNAGADLVANELLNGSEANSNPVGGGAWSYGKRNAVEGAALTLLSLHTDAMGGNANFQGWMGGESAFGGTSVPLTVANVSGTTVSDPNPSVWGAPGGPFPPNSLSVHPADGTAANRFNVVRWVAPVAGTYDLSANWADISSSGGGAHGVDVHLVINGTSVFDTVVSRELGPATASLSQALRLEAGAVVDFVVGPNGAGGGAYSNDGTAFNADIQLRDAQATAVITIQGANDLPALTRASASVVVDEGQTATNSGAFSDSDTTDIVSLTASSGTVSPGGTNSGSWNWSLVAAGDTDGPQTVTITATDSSGGVSTIDFTYTANNVAPTPVEQQVRINGSPATPVNGAVTVLPGMEVTYIVSASDPAFHDLTSAVDGPFSFSIDFGDSSPAVGGTANLEGQGIAITHVFTDAGSFIPTVTVSDSDGGTSLPAALTRVEVSNQVVIGDTLYVAGSGDNDRIIVSPSSGAISVRMNNRLLPKQTGVDTVVVYGYEGDDTLTVSGRLPAAVQFYGGDGDDYLAGGGQDDLLDGGQGSDRLLAGAGNDTLAGGGGNDTLTAGGGMDYLSGDEYADLSGGTFTGGLLVSDDPGNDTLNGEGGDDLIVGGDGNDIVSGGIGDDRILAGEGRDRVDGGDGADLLTGEGGDDILYGRGGRDVMIGGAGRDQLYGSTGADLIYGGDIDQVEFDQAALFELWMAWATGDAADIDDAFTAFDGASTDDGIDDTLHGEGDRDWYLTHEGDFFKSSAEKRSPNEVFER